MKWQKLKDQITVVRHGQLSVTAHYLSVRDMKIDLIHKCVLTDEIDHTHTHTHTYTYMFVYIYRRLHLSVCVCVCDCVYADEYAL